MPRRALLALLAPLVLAGCAAQDPPQRTAAAAPSARAYPLPPPSHLTLRADRLRGPRVMSAEHTHGRTLTMYGDTDARSRLLVAGCINGERCAGTDVVNAAMMGCPPPDAELWYFATLNPAGADLDADPGHPGAAAWRQAVADLRPRTTITFRTGPRAVVRASGAATRAARRYARIARLPFEPSSPAPGLAAWAAAARPGTVAFTVELPGERVSMRRAVRLAYAIDRLAGTRFAAGALSDRHRMIQFGQDPRESGH